MNSRFNAAGRNTFGQGARRAHPQNQFDRMHRQVARACHLPHVQGSSLSDF